MVEFALRQKVSSAGSRPRLDLQHLRTPQGHISLHCLLRDMPCVPWSAGVDEHLAAINLHIGRGLERICPTVATRARRPTKSEATWFHIRHRRELRRECHQQRIVTQRMLLSDCFQSWRRRRRVSTADTHLPRFVFGVLRPADQNRQSSHCRWRNKMRLLPRGTSSKRPSKQGRRAFIACFVGCCGQGAATRSRICRRLCCRPTAQWRLTRLSLWDSILQRRKGPLRPRRRLSARDRPGRDCVTLQAVKALSLPSLAHAFGAMATRKASGLSACLRRCSDLRQGLPLMCTPR